MIPEFGQLALILALCLAAAQVCVPALGVAMRRPLWMHQASLLALLQFGFLALSFACLVFAFVADDFSVSYVAHNSNTQTPLIYKISGVWGAHEGSLLLWVLMLAGWSAAVALLSRRISTPMKAKILAMLGVISIGFLLFTILTSNPFERLLPAPQEGRELNPLLQDFGLAIHPPMLYMGYVGFSVAYAFTIAALISGKMDTAWARWARQWATAAWVFLTLGIALGSWWAYYELGWGGWWFWDPVENASFMPWIAGTALIHSLAVTESRGAFRAWTAFLALMTFSLSLLGAFIVRSGILTSVHAFANDPARGMFILIFLALVVGSSLLLYAVRAPMLRKLSQAQPISREGGIFLNNLLLSAALVCVLLGTLYPLLLEVAGGEKISVGPPYFNLVFIPLTAPLAVLVGLGALARWKRDSLSRLARELWKLAVFALVVGASLPLLFGAYHLGAALGLILALWVTATSLRVLFPYMQKRQFPALGVVGMALGHLGLACFIAGVSMVSSYGVEKDIKMAVGDTHTINGYAFQFAAPVQRLQVANYTAERGEIRVSRGGALVAVLHPEKRHYVSQQQPMTEAAIAAGIWRDLFVSLGEPLGGNAWSVRLQVKPLMRWVWTGALLMALGGIAAILGRRQKLR